MRSRTIGGTGVSAIGLGGMPMSIEGRPESITDSARAVDLVLTDAEIDRLSHA